MTAHTEAAAIVRDWEALSRETPTNREEALKNRFLNFQHEIVKQTGDAIFEKFCQPITTTPTPTFEQKIEARFK